MASCRVGPVWVTEQDVPDQQSGGAGPQWTAVLAAHSSVDDRSFPYQDYDGSRITWNNDHANAT